MKLSHHVQNLIASLRGLPASRNHHKKTRNTLSINELIDSVSKKYNIGKHSAQDIIMANWQYIMGPENAQRACPSNISRNTLFIKISNPIVRNELQFHIRKILKRLQSLPHCQKIKRITFVSG